MTNFQSLALSGITLRAAVEGSGPLVVMVHGFPESWYSWRHQLAPIAATGFTACAIDVRGYGGSGKPHPVAGYDMAHKIADLFGVIENLSAHRPASVIGHDSGAPIASNSALTRPERVCALRAPSVPYVGLGKRSFREVFDELFTAKNRFFYQAYFQKEGVAEAELEANPRDSLRKFFYAISGDAPAGAWPNNKTAEANLLEGLADPEPFPGWLTPADLDYYVSEFKASGFRGPINRYRNHDRDFEFLKTFEGRKIEQPALFIGGSRDPAFNLLGRIDPIPLMRKEVTDLRGAHVLEGCGHWTQQERPKEVNEILLPWLRSL